MYPHSKNIFFKLITLFALWTLVFFLLLQKLYRNTFKIWIFDCAKAFRGVQNQILNVFRYTSLIALNYL